MEDIVSAVSEDDDAEKVRNYLISSYSANPKREFVLLVDPIIAYETDESYPQRSPKPWNTTLSMKSRRRTYQGRPPRRVDAPYSGAR